MTVTIQPVVHACECDVCKAGIDPAIVRYHRQLNLLMSRLTEPQRRWFVATLSQQTDSPSDRQLSLITGLDEKTIRRGQHDLADGLLDTLPRYAQPDADAIENLSMAIVVDQKHLGGGSHSTVGTITDIYSLLRLLYSRVGQPYVGNRNVFSFNDPQGMCPACNGIGRKIGVDLSVFLDVSKSLNEGAILFPEYAGFKLGLTNIAPIFCGFPAWHPMARSPSHFLAPV